MDHLTTYHEFDHDGKHYRVVYDDDYQVERACGGVSKCRREFHSGESEEECDKWYQEECDNLDSGKWVALGVIVTRKVGCPGIGLDGGQHCGHCGGERTEDVESCWGFVVTGNDVKEIEALALEVG